MKIKEANTVGIVGTVAEAPERYHNLYGRQNVYSLWLDTVRDSGAVDRILVIFQENIIDGETLQTLPGDYFDVGARAALITQGSTIEVTGKVQTYKDNESGRVQLFVWGLYMAAVPDGSRQINAVYMYGEIAKQPNFRVTPLGRRITDLILRIPSAFTEGFYSYVPCIAWGKVADMAAELPEDTAVYLEGRFQSREYIKKTPDGEKTLTTWEISISKMEKR